MILERGDQVTGKREGRNGETWTVLEVRGKTRVRVRHDQTGVPSFIRRDELEKNWNRVTKPYERTGQ